MEKDTRTNEAGAWKDAIEEARSCIIDRSRKRLKQCGPYKLEHKAYMALTVAICEAITAFIRLDETLK